MVEVEDDMVAAEERVIGSGERRRLRKGIDDGEVCREGKDEGKTHWTLRMDDEARKPAYGACNQRRLFLRVSREFFEDTQASEWVRRKTGATRTRTNQIRVAGY